MKTAHPTLIEKSVKEAPARQGRNDTPTVPAVPDLQVDLAPDVVDGWLPRTKALLAEGRLSDAIETLNRCLARDAGQIDALLLRAATHQVLGMMDRALADYGTLLALQPGNADVHYNSGKIQARIGEYDAALASYDAAIVARPDFPEAINNRGLVLKQLGRLEEALEAFKLAVALKPSYLEALRGQPEVFLALKQDVNALIHFDRALAIHPNDPILHNNRGVALQGMGRYEEALSCYDRALELKPDYPDALNNKGTTLLAFERFSESEASIRRALQMDPGKVSAHWNLSLVLLRSGRFEEGWREHEWRWKKDKFKRFLFGFTQPRWNGAQDLTGKTLLLTAEQGFGDSIQFVRYATLLHRRGARILLLVPRALVELFANNLPVEGVFNTTADLPPFDYHASLLSLPLAFGTTLETIPADVPYLHPPLSRRLKWENKLAPGSATRVGLVWAGNPDHANDMHRSISLSTLQPLFHVASCEFVVLQREIDAEDRHVLDAYPDIAIVGDKFDDFCDTAAVLSTLDLVITVDTAVAHLAGAMGKPVWMLIPLLADWRWLHNRCDSPWYPTMRLYRRSFETHWDAVVRQVASDLANFRVATKTSPPMNQVVGLDEALKAATVLHNGGRLDDAIAIYLGVLQIDPENFDANHLLGVARRAQGHFTEAEELILRALKARPNNLPALKNLARVRMSLGKIELALKSSDEIIARENSEAESWADRAVSQMALKRHDDALASLDRALELMPDHVNALNNRGIVLMDLGRQAEALSSLDRALALQPGFAAAIANRGLALLGLHRAHDAVANYRSGLELHPRSATLHCNLGLSLMALNRHIEAIASFRQAIGIDPNYVDANWNLSLALLVIGDYLNGWRQYEWRWKRVEMAPHARSFQVPLWTGAQDIAGRRLLLHFEQGFGDVLQFLRYVNPLAAAGAKIILGLPAALRHLAQASFPGIDVFCDSEALPPFELHCPLLSLPLACGTTLDSIPAANPPYLRPPAEKLAVWNDRLGKKKKGLRIGLAWSGNPAHKHDSSRSLDVGLMRPLLELPGTEFFGVQKDVRESDTESLRSMRKLKLIGDQFADFADTAAAISLLDLVIAVDTSVAHLAGALGKPVWIILPYAADWRWLADREDSPWYPTARLFRHQSDCAQPETMRRIAAALSDFRRQPRK